MDSFILHCSTRQYLLQHLALWPYNSQIAAAELHGCAAASVLQTLQACANSLHESAVAAEHNFALLLQRAFNRSKPWVTLHPGGFAREPTWWKQLWTGLGTT